MKTKRDKCGNRLYPTWNQRGERVYVTIPGDDGEPRNRPEKKIGKHGQTMYPTWNRRGELVYVTIPDERR